jgi:hypothetical protein
MICGSVASCWGDGVLREAGVLCAVAQPPLASTQHTRIHMHTNIYIYIYIYICRSLDPPPPECENSTTARWFLCGAEVGGLYRVSLGSAPDAVAKRTLLRLSHSIKIVVRDHTIHGRLTYPVASTKVGVFLGRRLFASIECS